MKGTNFIKWPLEVSAYEILHSLPDAVFTCDRQMRINYFNIKATELTGFRPIEALGMYCKDILKSGMCETECLVKKALDSNQNVFNVESSLTNVNGEEKHILVNASLLADSSGEIVGYLHVFRDISLLKSVMVELEDSRNELVRINKQLEKEINERKQAEEERKSLEDQLRQVHKMKAIGTLAGGVAHDFNNLLSGILGSVSLMLQHTDSLHPDYNILKNIEDYVQKGSDLTKQLLGFARGGKYEVKPADLNKLIMKSLEMFARTRKEIIIHTEYQENLWLAEVDKGQLEQVLLNLFINAWQAMPSGGDLYMQTENVILDENYIKPFEVKTGKYIKISITDNGMGMDEETQQRIFDPFFTTKKMGRGTGLGLASVYGIVKNHDGLINVYSKVDKGTTFTIYLPASDQEVAEETELSAKLIPGAGTVLLVDDEQMMIDVAEKMIQHLGFTVLVALSGEEAINIYKENKDKIDVVLLDMLMPGMDGGEVYDRLKEINPGVRALLSSGYSLNGEAQNILSRGCDGFVQKPYGIEELSHKLHEVMNER